VGDIEASGGGEGEGPGEMVMELEVVVVVVEEGVIGVYKWLIRSWS